MVPVFVVPHEFGFQSMIENYNGTWQAKVWARFEHGSLPDLQGHSQRYVTALRRHRADRIESAPRRRAFPKRWRLEPPGSTPGPDHLLEADQCGGDGGGAGPELRGGPALAESAGASGGGPGRGQDPHLPASPEGAEGPAALEGVAPSYQEEKVLGVTGRTCSIEHDMQIEHAHPMADRDHGGTCHRLVFQLIGIWWHLAPKVKPLCPRLVDLNGSQQEGSQQVRQCSRPEDSLIGGSLAEQGKEEAQEGPGPEGGPGEGRPSAQEAVTAARRTMPMQGWSSGQLTGLKPRSRGFESHSLRQFTHSAARTPL